MGKRTFQNCRFYRSGDVLFTDMEVFKGQGNDTDTSEEFEKYLVLCQDLVQVKMRNFSHF